MRIHRLILITCMLVTTMLFADGIMALGNYRSVAPDKKGEPINFEINSTDEPEGTVQPIPVPQLQPQTLEEIAPSATKPVNLLIMGLDGEEVRSDVIILLNYSPVQSKLNILSIARDTRVYVRGKPVKINALMAMGREQMVMDGVKKLTGISADYYITLNFKGFRKVVDTLGGVEMDIPMNMDYDDPEQGLYIHLKKGLQVLDGKKAEQFVRYRKGNRKGQGYEDGDIGRIRMQQEFMKALLQQKLKLRYLTKVDDIYLILKDYMRTNIELKDIRLYLKSLKNIKFDEIQSFTTPGDSAYINKIWYFLCDTKQTRELILTKFFR